MKPKKMIEKVAKHFGKKYSVIKFKRKNYWYGKWSSQGHVVYIKSGEEFCIGVDIRYQPYGDFDYYVQIEKFAGTGRMPKMYNGYPVESFTCKKPKTLIKGIEKVLCEVKEAYDRDTRAAEKKLIELAMPSQLLLEREGVSLKKEQEGKDENEG